MALLLDEIRFEWDDEDPTRFKMTFGNISLGFDVSVARQVADGLNLMADRIEKRIEEALDTLERD